MAQTKVRSSNGRSKTVQRKPTKARKSSAAKSKSPNGAGAASRKSSQASSGAKRARKRPTAPKNGIAHQGDAARKAVEGTAKQAGHALGGAAQGVGQAARKAKTPLIAGSAAVAGMAGGIALGARQNRHSKTLSRRPKVKIGPKVKIDSHDLAKAAKEVGQFGMDVGQLASELRKNREEANGARRRSPIEVVLQGLTNRAHSS